MLQGEHDDRHEAYARVDAYYERMGYERPPESDPEYRERFYYELDRIQRGE
jgi:hypothetical protein